MTTATPPQEPCCIPCLIIYACLECLANTNQSSSNNNGQLTVTNPHDYKAATNPMAAPQQNQIARPGSGYGDDV